MPTQFLERLKLGFGTREAKERQQEIERSLGLKGKFDFGDIADVVGGSLPLIGSILGAAGGTIGGFGVGGAVGAGIGAAAGEAVKTTIGQALGVRQEATPLGEALRPVVTGATTAAGFAIGGAIGKKLIVPAKRALTKIMPERLMSSIFKRSTDDFAQLMKTETWSSLQKTNPNLFNQYIKQGIIRLGKQGTIEVNPTLAQEVLERGLWGSSESMTKYAYLKQLQSESAVRSILTGRKESVILPNKNNYINLLNDISKEFSRQGRGFFSDRVSAAKSLVTKLQEIKGNKIDPMDLLELRRFLDGMRNTGSFRLNPNLAPKQEAFKIAADRLRQKLASVPGIASEMNEYRIWIEATESLVDYAVRTGNRRLLNLTDVILGGGGLAGGFPGTGLGIATVVRLFQTAPFLTGIAQTAQKVGQVTTPELLRNIIKFGIGRGIRGGVRETIE